MPREEKGSYVVYRSGYMPAQVTLGHLVLETYESPLGRRHHQSKVLDEEELEKLANIVPWSGNIELGKRKNMSFNVTVPAGGEVGPAYAGETERMISSQHGERIEIKDTQALLSRVLADPEVKATLKIWTSVSRAKYLTMRAHIRPPKIWLLTGLLVLKDATRCLVSKNDQTLRLGVSPEAVAALCGAPVGASIEVGTGTTAKVEAQLAGKLVYAARYQLVQTIYKTWDGNDSLAENEFRLHPDFKFTPGNFLGDNDGQGNLPDNNVAQLDLRPPGHGDSDDEELDDEYWKAFDEAERRTMRAVKRAQAGPGV